LCIPADFEPVQAFEIALGRKDVRPLALLDVLAPSSAANTSAAKQTEASAITTIDEATAATVKAVNDRYNEEKQQLLELQARWKREIVRSDFTEIDALSAKFSDFVGRSREEDR